jgi:hypothetical protein
MEFLRELLTETRQSQKLKFLSIANTLIRELGSINDNSEMRDKAGEDDIPKFAKKGQLSRQFKQNHQDLIGAARDLLKTVPSSNLKRMIKLPTTAFTSGSKNTSIKNSETMMQSMILLRDALKDMGEMELHHKLEAELNRFEDSQAAAKRSSKAANTAGLEKRNAELRNMQSKQRSQVEQIVVSVIETLPKHLQHEARQVVARSDNKLTDLENFLNNL